MENLLLAYAFMIGLIIGSFLNCFIWRLYKNESILGRSYCPHCRHKLAWFDNIPLFSFLFLKGKCRYCQKNISWQYPLVEFFTALLFTLSLAAMLKAGIYTPLLLIHSWLFIFSFILIFVYDLRWQVVPMVFIWPLIVIMFTLNVLLGFSPLILLLIGLAGALFFALQFLLTQGKGLGEGDIWLGFLMGVSLGRFDLLILALILAYFIGAIVGILLLVIYKKKLKTKIALGPFLASGAIIAFLYGNNLLNWYLHLL
ncbi:MAG: leader peptidase (prepilin peptidase) / N-methyltransferase [Patescibacteria group bacterium]|nr:leader peptidase (prepilin peptidase) / N-methyltransferase [Patescibacteria group bacterium]